jgi:hypothetical protein
MHQGRNWESLGEDVRDVVAGLDVEQLDSLVSDVMSNEVVANVDVLGALVVDVILGHVACALVVHL